MRERKKRERKRNSVYVCEREKEIVCICVRESDSVCVRESVFVIGSMRKKNSSIQLITKFSRELEMHDR